MNGFSDRPLLFLVEGDVLIGQKMGVVRFGTHVDISIPHKKGYRQNS